MSTKPPTSYLYNVFYNKSLINRFNDFELARDFVDYISDTTTDNNFVEGFAFTVVNVSTGGVEYSVWNIVKPDKKR